MNIIIIIIIIIITITSVYDSLYVCMRIHVCMLYTSVPILRPLATDRVYRYGCEPFGLPCALCASARNRSPWSICSGPPSLRNSSTYASS